MITRTSSSVRSEDTSLAEGNRGQCVKLLLTYILIASKSAYAATGFVRTVYNSSVQVQLVQAKSRVSSIKPLTIPWLGLLAATIGASLAVSVKKEIDQDGTSLIFWSDSSAVISWIKKEDGTATYGTE
jgi:hypothetical protein